MTIQRLSSVNVEVLTKPTPKQRLSALSVEVASTIGGHRYWRLACRRTPDNGSYIGLAEIEFRQTAGGADATGSGLGTAFGTQWVSTPAEWPQYAFDNVNTTRWQNDNGNGQGTVYYIGWDFGAGQIRDIREVFVRALHDVGGRNPKFIDVEYSDDDVTYTVAWTIFASSLAAGATATYTRPGLTSASSRWAVFFRQAHGGSTWDGPCSATEIELRGAIGGSDLMSGGTVTSMGADAGFPVTQAVDNNSSTMWIGPPSIGMPQWFAYQFSTDVDIKQIAYQARIDASYANETWKDFDLMYSPDGVNWITKTSYRGVATPGAMSQWHYYPDNPLSRRRLIINC